MTGSRNFSSLYGSEGLLPVGGNALKKHLTLHSTHDYNCCVYARVLRSNARLVLRCGRLIGACIHAAIVLLVTSDNSDEI